LLESLYTVVAEHWKSKTLSHVDIDNLLGAIRQIHTVATALNIALRSSLPKSTTVEGLQQEHASTQKQESSIDPDLTLDEIIAQSSKKQLTAVIYSPYYDVPAENQPAKIPKCTLGTHRACIANCRGKLVPTWELVDTAAVRERMLAGQAIDICNCNHTSLEQLKTCIFAHTLTTFAAIRDGVSTADVIRRAAPLEPVQRTQAAPTYVDRNNETCAVDLKKIVQNKTVLAMIDEGRARECTRTDPHNACSCKFLHKIASAQTHAVVSNQLYRFTDLQKNPGRRTLEDGTYTAGRLCSREKCNVENCTFVHLVNGAKPIPQPDREVANKAQTLPEVEKERQAKAADVAALSRLHDDLASVLSS